MTEISILFFFLFAHMLLIGLLSEMVLKTGDFKKNDMSSMASVEIL